MQDHDIISATSLSRRQLFGAGLALATAMVPGAAGAAAQSRALTRLEVYARARGGAGEEPGIWWYAGRLWGKPQHAAAVNLFAVEGCSFNSMRRRADGGLEQVMEECGFWKNPESREIVDDWINPLNGLRCRTAHYRSRQALAFGADGEVADAAGYAGHVTEPVVSGSTLWISESLQLSFPVSRAPADDPLTFNGPVRTATSLVTYTLDARAALADNAGYVPSTMNFQSMSNWYGWMRMGLAPGHMMFELFGRKLESVDELPRDLRRILDERRPGFLEAPDL